MKPVHPRALNIKKLDNGLIRPRQMRPCLPICSASRLIKISSRFVVKETNLAVLGRRIGCVVVGYQIVYSVILKRPDIAPLADAVVGVLPWILV